MECNSQGVKQLRDTNPRADSSIPSGAAEDAVKVSQESSSISYYCQEEVFDNGIQNARGLYFKQGIYVSAAFSIGGFSSPSSNLSQGSELFLKNGFFVRQFSVVFLIDTAFIASLGRFERSKLFSFVCRS